MPFLKKIERDLAVCAALLCPHCQKASKFKLQQVKTAIVLLRIPILDLHRSYQLACGNCGFQKDLEPRELFAAFRAKRLFSKLEKSEIDPAYYLRALEALKFPSLRELQKGAQTWNCPGCTEKVPENFNNCWKCGQARPDIGTTSSTVGEDAPNLPYAVVRPSNPWDR